MLTVIAAINWGDVLAAVGLSTILNTIITALLKFRELRTVWRRDRLTTAVADFLPAAASVIPLATTANYAHKGLDREDVTIAQAQKHKDALDALDQRMTEVRTLEIPVLLFMGKTHRQDVLIYTDHLADRLVAGITLDLLSFSDVAKEAETLHKMVLEAVRADFRIV